MSYYTREMVDKQAEIITKLNDDIRRLVKANDTLEAELAQRNLAAEYYLKLQNYAAKDEDVMEAWQDFLVLLKMKDEHAESKLQ